MARQAKTCQQCGKTPLYWAKKGSKPDGSPLWMLYDEVTMEFHKCNNHKQEDDMNRLELLKAAKGWGLSAATAASMTNQQLADYIRNSGGNVPDAPSPEPEAEAKPEVAKVDGSAGAALWALIEPHAKIDKAKIAELVQRTVEELLPKPTLVVVKDEQGETRYSGKAHAKFPLLCKLASMRLSNGAHLNIALSGPAGSFKTTAAQQLAEALSLPYYALSVGPQTSEAKLIGFANANGVWVGTVVQQAFEFGGVLLLDELDAGNPGVLTAVNALLSNGSYMFGTRTVDRHPDFICLAAMNTWGNGADTDYVGRMKMDAASRNRWVWIAWDYDEELERDLWAGQAAWVRYVQAVRAASRKAGVRIVVSPRASQFGSAMLDEGIPRAEVEELVLWAGVDADSKRKVLAAM